MPRTSGSAAQRGYGPAHQAERVRRLRLWKPGDLCARCGQPMWGPPPRIDLGHDHVNGGYLGLEHSGCNRGDGASRGNRVWQRRWGGMAASSGTRCGICGQPYHYPAQACGICGRHYHPSRKVQYTCSRTCGSEYRRRLKALQR